MKQVIVFALAVTPMLAFSAVSAPCSAALIQSGFNDVTGINSDGSSNGSPFDTGNASLNGQGNGEAGWAGPWQMSVGAAVVNSSTTFEGDGAAAFFQGSAAADRTLATAPTDPFSVTFELLLPTAPTLDVIFRVYDSEISNIFSAIAVQWAVNSNLQVSVLDGVEDSIDTGGPYSENTGIFLTTGVWHEMMTIIDPVSRTWTIAVDGVLYVPPDPLGFRGVPVNLDSIQFLSETGSPNGSFIDAVTVNTDLSPAAVPEPSVGLLTALGLMAFAGRRTLKFRMSR